MTKETMEEKIEKKLGPIRITKEAFDKGNYIARRVCELAQESGYGTLEVYLLNLNLIANQQAGDHTIRDFYIAQKQRVTAGSCHVDEGLFLSRDDAWDNHKMQVTGWSHSHGTLGSFLSTTDYNNTRCAVRFFSTPATIEEKVLCTSLDGSDLRNVGQREININGREFTIYCPDKELLAFYLDSHNLRISTKKKESFQWTGSFVFNSLNNKPFSFLATYKDKKMNLFENYPYEIIDEQNGIETDKKKIDEQIVTRVDKFRRLYEQCLKQRTKEYQETKIVMNSLDENRRQLTELTSESTDSKRKRKQELALLGKINKKSTTVKDFLKREQHLPFDGSLLEQKMQELSQSFEDFSRSSPYFEQRIKDIEKNSSLKYKRKDALSLYKEVLERITEGAQHG